MSSPVLEIKYLMLLLPTAVLEYDFGKNLATTEKLYLLIYLFRNSKDVIDKNGALVDKKLREILGNTYRTHIETLKKCPFNVISDELWENTEEYHFTSATINKSIDKINGIV